jgi:lipoprotein-releasing system ATP-binding protein
MIVTAISATIIFAIVIGASSAHSAHEYTVTRSDVLTGVTVSGTARCAQKTAVATELLATVKNIPVTEGQKVNPGDILMELDDRVVAAECAKALASVDLARQEVAEVKAGSRKEEITKAQQAIEQAQSKLSFAEADIHRQDQVSLNRFRNRHLGFVFQDDLLLGHLTALENVMVPARISRQETGAVRQRAEDILHRVGLGERMKHRPGELSGGQRQRVNIARALINSPDLLLADEPTARLDQANGKAIVQLLMELNEQLNVTILMVTHEREVARQADRIIEFLDGRIVSDLPVDDDNTRKRRDSQ